MAWGMIAMAAWTAAAAPRDPGGGRDAGIAGREAIDFSVDGAKLALQLEAKVGHPTPEERKRWEDAGWLEWRDIGGRRMYFNAAASNLARIKRFRLARPLHDAMLARDPRRIFRVEHTREIVRRSGGAPRPVLPVEMTMDYTVTVKADAVPAGEVVRCWIPWPREDHPRQDEVTPLSVSSREYLIAPGSVTHRSIYLEAKAIRGVPTVFRASCRFRSSGQYFDIKKLGARPCDRTSPLYARYTAEQPPHIRFTENVKRLADGIAGDATDPFEIVRRMYRWFDRNIPWTSALEYSIMDEIPEYVIARGRGDCGMQSMLLMTMLRYRGVPVRWQSGWMLDPGGANLHDWLEVHYEGVGWVPLDVEHGLQPTGDAALREFYLSGIDSYRMIVNDGIGGGFHPAKRHPRSEPNDFQRGEVEWSGGNLYFDQWDYDMKVTYGSAN